MPHQTGAEGAMRRIRMRPPKHPHQNHAGAPEDGSTWRLALARGTLQRRGAYLRRHSALVQLAGHDDVMLPRPAQGRMDCQVWDRATFQLLPVGAGASHHWNGNTPDITKKRKGHSGFAGEVPGRRQHNRVSSAGPIGGFQRLCSSGLFAVGHAGGALYGALHHFGVGEE